MNPEKRARIVGPKQGAPLAPKKKVKSSSSGTTSKSFLLSDRRGERARVKLIGCTRPRQKGEGVRITGWILLLLLLSTDWRQWDARVSSSLSPHLSRVRHTFFFFFFFFKSRFCILMSRSTLRITGVYLLSEIWLMECARREYGDPRFVR